MDYTQIKVNVDERVGVITLSHNPPRNSFTKRMLVEVLDALDEFEKNDIVRCVMLNSEGPNFSMGADFDDIDEEWSGEGEIKETFSELGGKLVARVISIPNPRWWQLAAFASVEVQRCSAHLIFELPVKASKCMMETSTTALLVRGAWRAFACRFGLAATV